MTLSTLYSELSSITASCEDRLKYANVVLNDLTLFPKLLHIVFMVDYKTSSCAAWVFVFVLFLIAGAVLLVVRPINSAHDSGNLSSSSCDLLAGDEIVV